MVSGRAKFHGTRFQGPSVEPRLSHAVMFDGHNEEPPAGGRRRTWAKTPHRSYGRRPQQTKPGFFHPAFPYSNLCPSNVSTEPPAASSTAWGAQVSHSIVAPKRG